MKITKIGCVFHVSCSVRANLLLMKVALLFFTAVAAVAASNYHRDLLDRAQNELDKDLFSRTISGATSPRFSRKKVTPL